MKGSEREGEIKHMQLMLLDNWYELAHSTIKERKTHRQTNILME